MWYVQCYIKFNHYLRSYWRDRNILGKLKRNGGYKLVCLYLTVCVVEFGTRLQKRNWRINKKHRGLYITLWWSWINQAFSVVSRHCSGDVKPLFILSLRSFRIWLLPGSSNSLLASITDFLIPFPNGTVRRAIRWCTGWTYALWKWMWWEWVKRSALRKVQPESLTPTFLLCKKIWLAR